MKNVIITIFYLFIYKYNLILPNFYSSFIRAWHVIIVCSSYEIIQSEQLFFVNIISPFFVSILIKTNPSLNAFINRNVLSLNTVKELVERLLIP